VSIALHAANAIFLFSLLARRLAPAAATIAAAFFATHPALFTAIYWQSARSDILAMTFALCTVALALRRGPERWLAVPSFTLAVLSKESVVFLPLAMWLIRRWAWKRERGEGATRDLLIPVLCLLSGSYGLYLLLGKTAGISVGTGPDAAYALDFGIPLGQNLLTYVGWTADVTMRPSPLRFVDVRNPDIYGLGIGSLIVWALGCLVPALRARGWLAAGATFLLLLVPLLPLRNHTYHYFLYAPLATAAWCLAAALDLVLARRLPRRAVTPKKKGERVQATEPGQGDRREFVSWTIAGACLALLTWNGARLVRRMETRPMNVYTALRGDPIVDRSIIAEKALDGLQRARLPQGVELIFLFRDRLALLARIALGSGEAPAPAEEVYPEKNLRTALFEGYGVRALIPQVAKVEFALEPRAASSRSLCVVYAPTGEVEVFTQAQLDSLMRSPWVNHW
jgi:hypothetical protein